MVDPLASSLIQLKCLPFEQPRGGKKKKKPRMAQDVGLNLYFNFYNLMILVFVCNFHYFRFKHLFPCL